MTDRERPGPRLLHPLGVAEDPERFRVRETDLEDEIHLWLPTLADYWETSMTERDHASATGLALAPRFVSRLELATAVRRLPPGEYEVVVGWRIEGRRQREVAAELHISEKTVGVWYRRALKRLARMIAEEAAPAPPPRAPSREN